MSDWRHRAACLGSNPDHFFPTDNEAGATAARTCATCPVRQPCLDFALKHRLFGIFGGTTAKDRERMGARPSTLSAADEIEASLRRVQARTLYRRGYSQQEMAAALGVSLAAIDKARQRGRL